MSHYIILYWSSVEILKIRVSNLLENLTSDNRLQLQGSDLYPIGQTKLAKVPPHRNVYVIHSRVVSAYYELWRLVGVDVIPKCDI